jgi:pentatricopeptide repeat protein
MSINMASTRSKPATSSLMQVGDEGSLVATHDAPAAGGVSPGASLHASLMRSRPERPVYLAVVNKADPLKRNVRDVSRRHKQAVDFGADKKPRDEDRDAIYACAKYTEHFNNLLKKLPKRNRRAVTLVIERMRAENVPMDQTTYNLMLEKVVDLRDDFAFTIYDEFKDEAQRDDASVRPDLTTFQLMVRACERNGDYRRAFHIYSQMRELFGVYPDVPLYNTLIGYCAPLRDETTASYIVEEMKDYSVEPDVHTYNSLMNVFADAPYELILQTFEDMVKRKLKPNRRTFNTLMKACQKIGDYDRAFQFFEELKREGLAPDVSTYNILIVACRDRLDYVVGTGKFQHVRRSKEQREVGIRAIAQLSMSLLAEMEETEIAPNTFTYNALFAVLSRCCDQRMYELFEQMKDDEQRQAKLVPVDMTQQQFAIGDGQTPTFAELERMLTMAVANPSVDDQGDRIGAAGVSPNLETYAAVIEGSALMHQPDEAYRLFDEMKLRGIQPDRAIFIKLIDVCSLNAEKTRAFAVFEEAKAQGLTPDTELYNALLNVLAECCDAQVFDIFNDLKYDRHRLSIKPNQDSYNILLKASLKQNNLKHALMLHEEMCDPSCIVSPDTVSYGLLMDVCAAHRDVALAADFILDMKRRNVAPTINTYSRFMNVFVQADDPGVVEVFDDIKRHGPAPNLEAYTTLLDYYFRTKNDAITALFEDMMKAGVEPDLNAYNIMLNHAAIIGNHQRSFKYLEELKMRGLNADITTYNALIAVFAPAGSDFICKVFEEMSECHIQPDQQTLAILMKHKAGRQALQVATDRRLVHVGEPRK